jgi:hypothetical protein
MALADELPKGRRVWSSPTFGILGSLAVFAIALSYVASAVVGVVANYNSLPFWDSWDGYLDDLYKISHGDLNGWWAQHNEHRILLARLLFWVDLHLFGGQEIFLLVTISLVALLTATILVVCLTHILRQSYGTLKPRYGIVIYAAIALAGSFSWMQSENLVWGFQTQFVLVTALPLATFILLGLSSWLKDSGRGMQSLWAISLAGFAACGAVLSMSGGLATPWIALLGLMALRYPWKWVSFWLIGSIGLTIVYLVGYATPPGQVSVLHTLKTHPLEVGLFFLRYVGGPAMHVTGSLWLATLSGAVLVALTLLFAVKTFRHRKAIPSAFALTLFNLYILAIGALTAMGRVPFGMDGAFSSRYATPVIALWLALMLLGWVEVRGLMIRYPIGVAAIAAVLLLVPAGVQSSALASATQLQADRNLAGIAISLDIPDPEAIHALYPDPHRPLAIKSEYQGSSLTPLGQPPFADMKSQLGSPKPVQPGVNCQDSLNLKVPSAGAGFLRVAGSVLVTGRNVIPSIADLVNEHNQIVGYVSLGTGNIFGSPPSAISPSGSSMFSGYVLSGETGLFHLSGSGWACRSGLK